MENETTQTVLTLNAGDRLLVVKGCRDLQILKGARLNVRSVEILGVQYSRNVKIVVEYRGRVLCLYARHVNRLSDDIINLNNGNPCNLVQVKKG